MMQSQNFRIELEAKNARISQLQEEIHELSDHATNLENEYRIKEKLINELSKVSPILYHIKAYPSKPNRVLGYSHQFYQKYFYLTI